MIKRYLAIFLLIFTGSSMIVLADEEKNEAEKKEKTKTIKPGISKRAQIKTLEEFIPSEEVSADKPVAFPNDI